MIIISLSLPSPHPQLSILTLNIFTFCKKISMAQLYTFYKQEKGEFPCIEIMNTFRLMVRITTWAQGMLLIPSLCTCSLISFKEPHQYACNIYTVKSLQLILNKRNDYSTKKNLLWHFFKDFFFWSNMPSHLPNIDTLFMQKCTIF